MTGNTPCWNDLEYSGVDGQKFYFGELRKNLKSCQKPNDNFSKIAVPADWSIDEYSLQEQSGVLD